MPKPFPILLLALCLLLPFAGTAHACRPFGSYGFAEDREGGLWFTEGDNNAVSRLSRDGTVSSHPLPTPAAEPSSVAVDRKGNVWFAEMDGRRIGQSHGPVDVYRSRRHSDDADAGRQSRQLPRLRRTGIRGR